MGLLHNPPCTIVGTVPPQHMYGFESTVLLAWHSGNALSHAQPFYPADICQALAAVPTPRVLVSSPVHLRAWLDAGLALPEIALVVCATAPLSAQLAQDVEAGCHAPLIEIYGSTETGQIASRRSTQTAQWQLFPGIKLIVEGDCVRACGGHIETLTAMSDLIEPVTDELFLLHGRIADLVNIAGKRHSLASLNHLLSTIPGVVDGAFYMPDETGHDHVTRLAACVVAPGLDAPHLLAALREHIDPVFLPRPLLLVDALPRNSTGKLPRAALQALIQTRSRRKPT
jgi:acyl-coenzyme A synthetase/AMP-(fatty) acid ligase